VDVVICIGPAGSGKTRFAVEEAWRQLATGKRERVMFVRPAVSCDEDLGALPGSMDEKLAPFMKPMLDFFGSELRSKLDCESLGHLRGRNIRNTFLVADEMQNATITQLEMVISRLSSGSKIVILGDPSQIDRRGVARCGQSYLEQLHALVAKDGNRIRSIRLRDIKRHPTVQEAARLFEKLKETTSVPQKCTAARCAGIIPGDRY
jgi:phosphate starvation-inducible PhoH-like protein